MLIDNFQTDRQNSSRGFEPIDRTIDELCFRRQTDDELIDSVVFTTRQPFSRDGNILWPHSVLQANKPKAQSQTRSFFSTHYLQNPRELKELVNLSTFGCLFGLVDCILPKNKKKGFTRRTFHHTISKTVLRNLCLMDICVWTFLFVDANTMVNLLFFLSC